MCITKTIVLTCSLAVTAPALAQEQTAAFEYSPVARLTQSGQFRAEVWRHDVGADNSDVAWSNAELSPTAAMAMSEACASLQNNFNAAFSCSASLRAVYEGRAAPRAAAPAKNPLTMAVAKKVKVSAGERKVRIVKAPMRSPRVASELEALNAPGAWLKDFWRNQERASGGGEGGGGGGGSD